MSLLLVYLESVQTFEQREGVDSALKDSEAIRCSVLNAERRSAVGDMDSALHTGVRATGTNVAIAPVEGSVEADHNLCS